MIRWPRPTAEEMHSSGLARFPRRLAVGRALFRLRALWNALHTGLAWPLIWLLAPARAERERRAYRCGYFDDDCMPEAEADRRLGALIALRAAGGRGDRPFADAGPGEERGA